MPSETGHNLGQTNNQFLNLAPYGIGQPGSVVVGGGGGVPEPFFRDQLDSARSVYRRTPDAQYPDGYLGTITSRKGDKMFDALKNRVNQRSYQRGVHKGERIDPADYYWPEEYQPDQMGLVREQYMVDNMGCPMVAVARQAPVGLAVVYPTSEAILPASGVRLTNTLNPRRQAQLRHLSPTWRW
jgi:hypothetical protein